MAKKNRPPTHPWAADQQELLRNLDTTEQGLGSSEAGKRLKKYGLNEIAHKNQKSLWHIVLEQFISPLILVLIAACIISLFLGEGTDALIILGIVIINSIIGLIQEYRAEKTVRALRKIISLQAKVLRDYTKIEVDTKYLVPGDIVYLNIGDIVPADIRLLHQDEMTIDESSLTGESIPVLKTTSVVPESHTLPHYLKNIAFMGTYVISGDGYGVIIATGERTSFGKTAAYLKEPELISDFEKNISSFSKFLLKVILLIALFIFIVNTFLHNEIIESFLFALALAVGITPEALPIIITISLSKGAQKLAKNKVIIKKLSSIEDLGNMDILCTDKTGTLTEGILSLQDFINPDQKKDPKLLLYGLLCNNAIVSKKKVEGNIIDRAIWESKQKAQVLKEWKEYAILDHNEFDFERRRMSVVIQNPQGQRYLLVKGAIESLEPIATKIMLKGKVVPLTAKKHSAYLKIIDSHRKRGYSTIGLAIKPWKETTSTKADEKDLALIGFLTFLDPPREGIRSSLAQMQSLGVAIKVLSGDDPLVTEAICKKVGLSIQDQKIYTGDELDLLNDQEFKTVVEKYNIFSRIAPAHKYKIVKTLNTGSDRTIAFIGDGINDAPAIKVADVGISVNTATDMVKEAADIILLHNSLQTVVIGIMEGRKIFSNITKYILSTVSANYGNIFTLAATSTFLKFIPLLPSQILLNNLVTDTPMLAIATDNVDVEMLKKPKKLDIKMIRRVMKYFGFLSTFFNLLWIFILIFIIKADPTLFRTAWFFESALSEVILTFSARTDKIFYKSIPSKLMIFMSAVAVIMLAVLIYSPLGKLFDFVQLNAWMVLFIIGIISLYFISSEVLKKYFFKKYQL